MAPHGVHRFYPPSDRAHSLEGCYLAHDLRTRADDNRPFIYTNFIASIDGRIADRDPVTRRKRVPPLIANPRDWRLYMELAAQADVVLTTANHLHAIASGRSDLFLESAKNADLRRWRLARGLSAHPKLAVITRRLDLPVVQLRERAPEVLAVTGAGADGKKAAELARQGIEVLVAGAAAEVEGKHLIKALVNRGLRVICSVCGPTVLQVLLAGNLLDRIYLTLVLRLLGERGTDGLVREWYGDHRGFALHELYYDHAGANGTGQLFISLERQIAASGKSPV